jgi:ABC-type sugar transport system substrate-binding protein
MVKGIGASLSGETVTRRALLRTGGVMAGTVVAGGALAACGSSSSTSTSAATSGDGATTAAAAASLSDKTVGVASPIEVAILQEFYDTMRRQASQPGNGEKINVVDANGDSSKQHTQVDAFIAQGANAVAMFVLTADGWEPAIQKATKAGIGMFNHSASPIAGCTQNVGLDQRAGGAGPGAHAAKWINANFGGKADVGVLSILNDPQLRQRSDGFKAALAQSAPGAKIVGEANAQTREEGAKAAANLLQAHPDIKVIYAAGDDPGLGALSAATEAGKTNPKEFFIGSSDGTDAVFEKLTPTSIYQCTWSFLFPLSATQFERDIEAFLQGKKVQPTRIVYGELVTAQNLAEIRKLFADPQAPAVQKVYQQRMKYSDYQLKTNESFVNAFK